MRRSMIKWRPYLGSRLDFALSENLAFGSFCSGLNLFSIKGFLVLSLGIGFKYLSVLWIYKYVLGFVD